MGEAEEIRSSLNKSILARSYAYALLDLAIPAHFLGITGQMRRNTYALKLGSDLVDDLITPDEAIEKLRMFNESLFNDLNEKWIQLPLWNQLKLDQL